MSRKWLWSLHGLALIALGATGLARANDGVVGPGNCDQAGFASVLSTVNGSGGGTITFNCGSAPVTITLTHYKSLSSTLTIDGGDRIVFDGGNTAAWFQVLANARATLKNLTLQHGVLSSVHALENSGELSLDHVHVINNTGSESPVVNSGTLDVSASTFSGNTANDADGGNGGAIYSTGALTITGSTFNGNTASVAGGAIWSAGALDVSNSTFSANSASSSGGAIRQSGNGAGLILFGTVVGNTAPIGAGVYNDASGGSTLALGASIVSANTGGNCGGTIASNGFNLSDGTSCSSAFTGTGDLVAQTLSVQALANYGGPTATRPPLSGNPAINHVPSDRCAVAVDQRGDARPSGAGCDSGAVEINADLIFANSFD
jgi:predicted outer membrane repeat protein